MAKPIIQTIKHLKDVLKNHSIQDSTPLFFFYQSPEEAGLKSKSFEWKATGICIETDDSTGQIRVGLYSQHDPEVTTVESKTENLQ